jgi:glutamate carboxypeptidase
MVKKLMPSRVLRRIEQLMGQQLKARDLSFVEADLPVTELELLKRFTALDTQTLHREGVERAQQIVSEVLESLGFKLKQIVQDPRFAQLVLAERPGKVAKFITLVTHTDTVLGNEQPFTVDLPTNIAGGSGVIDNKGGVVVGLSGLTRFLRAFPETHYSLRVVCSPNEEMGSIGFTPMFRELGADTVVGFGLEPALDNGAIIHQRRGNRWYDVTITGHEAHAGRSYGEHGNAAHDIAHKIYQLSQLTNYRKHLSVNVGRIDAGKDKHNIICGFAHAKVDVRFPSLESRDYLHRKIEKILSSESDKNLCGENDTSSSYKIVDDCPPFSLTRRSKRLARSYAALISQLEGRKVYSQPAGGAGDVNYLSTADNFILDGLGPVGGNMHTNREFLRIDSLQSRSKALAGFLHHLQSSELLGR